MKRNWFVRTVAIVLAAILLASVLFAAISAVTASAVTQSEIDELKSNAEELQQQKADLQGQINSAQSEQASVLEQKALLDEKVMLTQQEIDNISEQIAAYEILIQDKTVELAEAQQAEDDQWELYKKRMRAMEENGTVGYLDVILDAGSFSDLLATIDFVGEIMEYDEMVYHNLQDARIATADAKAALEETQAAQEAEKENLEYKKAELEQQVEEASALLAQIESDIELYKQYISEVDAKEAQLQADIDAKVEELRKQEEEEERRRQEEEQRRQQEAASAGNSSSGSSSNSTGSSSSSGSSSSGSSSSSSSGSAAATGYYIWPASSYIITSPFGTRLHPIWGTYRTHYGADIGASYGTNVLAADGGTVITSTYDSSYGYYIAISHGGGRVTMYAHMSQLLASEGDVVSQGEVIGLVGSTGDSTGPHLHFEVRVDGTRVDPLDYFDRSSFTIWDD